MSRTKRPAPAVYLLPACELHAIQALDPEFYCALLASESHQTAATPHAQLERYSFLFCDPLGHEVLAYRDLHNPDALHTYFSQCDWSHETTRITELPFIGGYVVVLRYELNQALYSHIHTEQSTLPLAHIIRVPAAIVIDHVTGECFFVDEAQTDTRYTRIMSDIAKAQTHASPKPLTLRFQSDEERGFIDKVNRTLEYIRAGDVFQVNLSHSWQAQLPAAGYSASSALYNQLRQHNPAPFAALVHMPDTDIIASSPERLFRAQEGVIQTRPIAGTSKRQRDPTADAAARRALFTSHKERAEHTMLVDLERNDLNKICHLATTHISEPMHIESHAFVHHLVSEVTGTLKPHVTLLDIIRAIFPGGSITGCPKVRCMQIIQELETVPRGCYTGALGFVSHHGVLDFAILIRTLVRHGDILSLHAGSGIVFDSTPEQEWHEVRTKAHSVLHCMSD